MAKVTATTKARILLVDDHPMVRRGLSEIISNQPDLQVCGDAEDVNGALVQYRHLLPDLMIVDISLKDGHGIDLIKSIKSEDRQAKILVFSMHEDALFAERVLHAGALGYVNKQVDSQVLLDALRRVLSGQVYVHPDIAQRILMRLADRVPTPEMPLYNLTDRELEVFEAIGHGQSSQQIAERLFLSVKTIETYRDNIKRKLDLTTPADLTRHAVLWLLDQQEAPSRDKPE